MIGLKTYKTQFTPTNNLQTLYFSNLLLCYNYFGHESIDTGAASTSTRFLASILEIAEDIFVLS